MQLFPLPDSNPREGSHTPNGFAAALAQRESAALITGDPELKRMSDVLSIEWIGHDR
jgi:hypothetical protein